MNIGEERARAILLSRGVQPVSLPWGKERKTLRWPRRAVMTVIDTLHAEAQAKAGVPKRRRSLKTAGCVIGKSSEELFAEFNMGAVQVALTRPPLLRNCSVSPSDEERP